MRTRKHQSPGETTWVDKPDAATKVPCEVHTGLSAPDGHQESANGFSQYDSGENSQNIDQKKVNGKKQKRRRRSPRTKGLLPKVDCMLSGLMADKVWFDKHVYEEAESAYHAMLAKTQHTKPSNPVIDSETQGPLQVNVTDLPNPIVKSCSHGSLSACHHVSNGVWVNKFHFDDAEREFAQCFASPLSLRLLVLPLASREDELVVDLQRASDEGYVSATPTPASRELTPVVPTGNSVNGKPQWVGLQDLMAEVWLEKPSFDQAERSFYEHLARQQCTSKAEPSQFWSSGKKGKREKMNRKPPGRQPQTKKRGLASIPEEGHGLLQQPVYYFLHQDSENVWLNKAVYDQAEQLYYVAQSQDLLQGSSTKKPAITKPQKPTKCKRHVLHPQQKTMSTSYLCTEKIWFDRFKYEDAETQYYENLSKKLASNSPNTPSQQQEDGASTILRDIARARENIQKSLSGSTAAAPTNNGENGELLSRVASLEHENQSLHKVVQDLQLAISKLECRINTLEKSSTSQQSQPTPAVCKFPAPVDKVRIVPAAAPAPVEKEDDDDIDLFGSDEEEDAEAERIREERLRQYAEKKSKKPGLIAKSSILLDVKPWDDETDMAKLEDCVRSVQMDGLVWGSSKLVPVGYGIKKLQIQCVVEDDKVGTDMLEEEITKFEDYVQSVDIAAFNKI
uniref:Elongation factor 1-delta n=1 Tax=Leptobrachium leishanense TaxID=445787 RepID=A0A8C5PSX8_9ANUR